MNLLSQAPPDLLRACAWVFLFGWLITSRHLPLRWSAALAAIKVAIPLVYFIHNPFGSMHLGDDLDYFYGTLTFLKVGFEPLSILADPRGLPLVMEIAGTGQHIVYPLWNLFGVLLFGPHYYTPVLLNVGLTFVSGWIFFRLLRALDFPPDYGRFALAFFLLHWDTVAWSSFLNLKESLVTTVTLALAWQVIALLKRPEVWRVLPIGLLVLVCHFLRFYVPLLIAAAVIVHFFLRVKSLRARVSLGILLGVAAWMSVVTTGVLRRIDPAEIFWGIPQITLTPLPWNLSAGYEFLLVPSGLHLLLIVPVMLVAPTLWNKNAQARFLLIYFLVFLVVFSMVPQNRGIRQRQTISFVFIWMQFHALWVLWHYLVRSIVRLTERQGLGRPL